MGCSSSSFEINKSKENIPEDNGDDYILGLMKRRMIEDKDKEIENHDLNKIKNLGEDLDENNNEEKDNELNEIENKDKENMILNNPENDKGNNNEDNNNENDNNKENENQEFNNDIIENNEINKDYNNELNSPEDMENPNATDEFIENKVVNKNVNIIDKYFKSKKLKKSTLYKTKLNNTKTNKEPFTLKTEIIDSINLSTLTINASCFLREYLIPIWFQKDAFIKFVTSGKWRIDKTCDYTDTKGMPTPNTLDFNYGACIARIGSGNPFVILPNGFTYITKTEGPLYLKMNLPRKMKVYPEGFIEMEIYDGEVLPLDEIYRRIGWKENIMKYGNNKGTEMENNLMSSLNNLRMNPILFYEKFFRDIKNIVWIEKFLQEKESKKNKVLRKPFLVNNHCYNLLDKFVNNNYVNKTNINKQKVTLYLSEMKENVELFVNNELKCRNLVNCKLTQKYKINDICLQYLLDKKFRNYIFSNEFNYITVKIIEKYIDESSLIIICLSKLEEKIEDNETIEHKENEDNKENIENQENEEYEENEENIDENQENNNNEKREDNENNKNEDNK